MARLKLVPRAPISARVCPMTSSWRTVWSSVMSTTMFGRGGGPAAAGMADASSASAAASATSRFTPLEVAAALAAVGRQLVDDAPAADQVQGVEALAQLARLGVAHVDAVADSEVRGQAAEHRGLHLPGAFPRVQPETAGEVRQRQ